MSLAPDIAVQEYRAFVAMPCELLHFAFHDYPDTTERTVQLSRARISQCWHIASDHHSRGMVCPELWRPLAWTSDDVSSGPCCGFVPASLQQ